MSNLNPHDMWAKMKKNSDGLVPAITVDYENGEVLMMAYMNEEAFCLTCETGFMHYYSRSRNSLWKKGWLRMMTDRNVRRSCRKPSRSSNVHGCESSMARIKISPDSLRDMSLLIMILTV